MNQYLTISLILHMAMSATTASGPVVAPNTTRYAFESASAAVVKLYGRGLGREHGYGTGFLVSNDGRIITTAGLLSGGGRIRAVLADGRAFPAQLVRTDNDRQLALLKIDAGGLPHLDLVATDHLAIGDGVIALGNWYKIAEGHEPVSVNRGILSLRTNLHARRLTQDYPYRGPILVIDAITSNPGAPGGPLLDIDGRCVGIVGRVVEAVSTNTRLNYALPSEEVLAFLGGKPTSRPATAAVPHGEGAARPYVGIRISRMGFHHVSAYVERVRPGSPAAEAGIRPDDLIVAIDGNRIADTNAYKAAVQKLAPGRVVPFVVKRGNKLVRFDIRIGEKE